MTNSAKVAIVRTNNRTTGVPKAIDLLNINPVQGKRVALKPNFNTADPCPGSTHNDTLRALIQKIQAMGATHITIAERSGPANTGECMQQKGILDMAKELNFDVLNLEETKPSDWVRIQPDGSHWANGFEIARIYNEAECVVQTCCLKTHGGGGHFSMSLKLAVGMVAGRAIGAPYMTEMHQSEHQRKMIAEMNAGYTPDLIVLDGVETFTSGGPAKGERVNGDIIIAGIDRIAIDAVGVAVLRLLGTTPEVSTGPVFAQEQIARAVELGLGVDYPSKIELITNDEQSKQYASRIEAVLLR
ncbi:MAG: DUF362 domain-containing protein [Chloroflexi bacterium]|jgi:uncharacterized protein (DUF362 family)|nr:DUF362 domain-containing protein [Chloroflexota bacterium]MBT7080252.1 DUF362 domain-containing protein [Chloroflexota bacterium]MBT7289332.1 DUF362 domain-containing protein [Chloroflexota bacterium]